MNPELKAKWVAALRSGKYEQGHEYLNKDGKFCCLGVLCDVAGLHWAEATPIVGKIPEGQEADSVLEKPLRNKFGLSKSVHDDLWHANDGAGRPNGRVARQLNFTQLADKIERSKRI